MPEYVEVGGHPFEVANASFDISRQDSPKCMTGPEQEGIARDGFIVRPTLPRLPRREEESDATDQIVSRIKEYGLLGFLEQVDDVFDRASTAIAAKTAVHSWVLIPTEGTFLENRLPKTTEELELLGVPTGYMLGAKVEYIQGVPLNIALDARARIELGLYLSGGNSTAPSTSERLWGLGDCSLAQLLIPGFTRTDARRRPITDIEDPRIANARYVDLELRIDSLALLRGDLSLC